MPFSHKVLAMTIDWSHVALCGKDTVSADEENDEVDAGQRSKPAHSAIRLNTMVHYHVPVFSGQNLTAHVTKYG